MYKLCPNLVQWYAKLAQLLSAVLVGLSALLYTPVVHAITCTTFLPPEDKYPKLFLESEKSSRKDIALRGTWYTFSSNCPYQEPIITRYGQPDYSALIQICGPQKVCVVYPRITLDYDPDDNIYFTMRFIAYENKDGSGSSVSSPNEYKADIAIDVLNWQGPANSNEGKITFVYPEANGDLFVSWTWARTGSRTYPKNTATMEYTLYLYNNSTKSYEQFKSEMGKSYVVVPKGNFAPGPHLAYVMVTNNTPGLNLLPPIPMVPQEIYWGSVLSITADALQTDYNPATDEGTLEIQWTMTSQDPAADISSTVTITSAQPGSKSVSVHYPATTEYNCTSTVDPKSGENVISCTDTVSKPPGEYTVTIDAKDSKPPTPIQESVSIDDVKVIQTEPPPDQPTGIKVTPLGYDWQVYWPPVKTGSEVGGYYITSPNNVNVIFKPAPPISPTPESGKNFIYTIVSGADKDTEISISTMGVKNPFGKILYSDPVTFKLGNPPAATKTDTTN